MKKFELRGNQPLLTEIVNLTFAKFTSFRTTKVNLQRSVKYLRAITMCRTFTHERRYFSSIFKLIGKVSFSNE